MGKTITIWQFILLNMIMTIKMMSSYYHELMGKIEKYEGVGGGGGFDEQWLYTRWSNRQD